MEHAIQTRPDIGDRQCLGRGATDDRVRIARVRAIGERRVRITAPEPREREGVSLWIVRITDELSAAELTHPDVVRIESDVGC